jgi:rare lipoprotein A
MNNLSFKFAINLFLLFVMSWCLNTSWAAQPATDSTKQKASKTHSRTALDHSGKTQKGKASFYSRKFAGKTMADGTRMNPDSNVAASKTLPLGTKARVTNLHNGKSTIVVIKDRGPYVDGRIVDLSPKAARKLGFETKGVAPVTVVPIEIPQPDGTAKRSAVAANTVRD